MSTKAPRVLIAPLDWGLGHATRCVPIITALQSQGCMVFIAGSGASLLLLRTLFPKLSTFKLPSYNPTYAAGSSQVIKLISQLPALIKTIRQEHQVVGEICHKEQIDYILSDNRYGCWSQKTYNIFITHQVNILLPQRFRWLERLTNALHRKFIHKFNICWIPDWPGDESMAGALAQSKKISAQRIGCLSRFSSLQLGLSEFWDVVVMISGPEIQRSCFEEIAVRECIDSNLRCLVIRGLVEEQQTNTVGNVTITNFLPVQLLANTLKHAGVVVARSGYSTIMDLAALEVKRVIFVPTPGQTEQEYLARKFGAEKKALHVSQHHFSLKKAIKKTESLVGLSIPKGERPLLQETITALLAR